VSGRSLECARQRSHLLDNLAQVEEVTEASLCHVRVVIAPQVLGELG
jgi:hypothetical protein